MKKIIVIGGGAAGAKAASKAKRLNPENSVELYTSSEHISVSRCGLPYFIEGTVNDISKLIIKTPDDFLKMGISVYLKHTLEKIIPENNCVVINGNHIFYDELILATGARVNVPEIENNQANNIFTLRSLESGIKIREKMLQSKTAIIIGAGAISAELTEAFIVNGLNVKLIEKNERVSHDFDEDFSKAIQNMYIEKCQGKIEIFLNENVKKIKTDENNNFISVLTESGKEISADFCVFATGTIKNVEVAKSAGINIGSTGAIYVDTKMKTNFDNIYACGDCAEKYCIVTKRPTYLGLGAVANKEGRTAAINATYQDGYELFKGILKSKVTKFFDYTVTKTGLTYNDAVAYSKIINIEPIFVTVTKKDKASYMPNGNELTIKIIADKRNGELLGAQAIGLSANVLQRINTIASALESRFTVNQLLHLDLPYAPPYSTSIDPVITAAYKLKEQIEK